MLMYRALVATKLTLFRRQRQRPGFAPAGDLLFLLVQAKKAKEHALLSASLRFATGKPASRDSVCGGAQRAARRCRYAQTSGGKSEYEATLSCGSVARSLNYVPQAQTQGVDTGFAGLVTQ